MTLGGKYLCEIWRNHDKYLSLNLNLEEAKSFRIPSFNIIRKDRNTSNGGVLIGIRENIEFKYLFFSIYSEIE